MFTATLTLVIRCTTTTVSPLIIIVSSITTEGNTNTYFISYYIINSFFSFLLGIFLYFFAIRLMWYVKKKIIKVKKVLNSSLKNCIDVNPLQAINTANNNKLVCISGELTIKPYDYGIFITLIRFYYYY